MTELIDPKLIDPKLIDPKLNDQDDVAEPAATEPAGTEPDEQKPDEQTPDEQKPPWIPAFTILDRYRRPEPGGRIQLAQVDRKMFELRSIVQFNGDTGLAGKVPPRVIRAIRTVTPTQLPRTDLASVPVPLRWFVESYGAHTPAALIHDNLIGNPQRPKGMTDADADRFFRYMLRAVGVSWLRRSMMWAAVALRSRWVASWTNKVQLVLWVLLAGIGMTAAVLAVVHWSWEFAAVAVVLPFVSAALWGRQYGAGLVAVIAAPWLLPPTVLAVLGYAVYWVLEKIAGLFGAGGLEFRLFQPAPKK